MMSLNDKIHVIQSKLHRVEKSGTNNFSKYSYSTLADMLLPLRPYLEELGLVLTQSIRLVDAGATFNTDSYYSKASVECTTTIIDKETGESYSILSPGFSMDKNSDKACYKAITGARKYGVSALFALEWFSVEPEDPEYDDKRFNNKQQSNGSAPQSQQRQSRFGRN